MLVADTFFAKEGRKDTNLTFVQDRVRSSPPDQRRRMLKLYGHVFNQQAVANDDRSPTQNYLELFGLVAVDRGRLRVRNQIYRQIFDHDWIKANMPANTQRNVAIAAIGVTVLLIAFIIYRILNPGTQAAIQADVCIDNFSKTTSSVVRLEALSCVFERGYDERARRLFYEDLGEIDQKYLFLKPNLQAGAQMATVVKGLYVTLDAQMPNDLELMEAMVNALEATQQSGSTRLIGRWPIFKSEGTPKHLAILIV